MQTSENQTLESLGLTGAILQGAIRAGYTVPKPIQVSAIPPHLEGRDIVAIAQTGSGKTAAFTLPIIAKIAALGSKRLPKTARALILAPTRELAVQIEETIRDVTKGMHISTALVLGGVSRFSQVKRIAPGIDILIATPGRLVDLVSTGDVKLSETRWLVLDEADRMLDMGFINDVKRLARATHVERQTALYSATMPTEIASLADTLLRDPVRVEVAPQGTTAAEITQEVHIVPLKQKRAFLSGLLADAAMKTVIIFARTKHGADRVARDLERDGFEAGVIHGNKSQNARQKALNAFRDGSVRILVATDIAARGIDVPGITHVINFDLPDEAESYVHRIGRTGRNGASGTAITLCDPTEGAKLRSVEKVTRSRLPIVSDQSGGVPLDEKPQPVQRQARGPKPAQRSARQGDRQAQKPAGQRPAGKPFRGKRRFGNRKPASRAA